MYHYPALAPHKAAFWNFNIHIYTCLHIYIHMSTLSLHMSTVSLPFSYSVLQSTTSTNIYQQLPEFPGFADAHTFKLLLKGLGEIIFVSLSKSKYLINVIFNLILIF